MQLVLDEPSVAAASLAELLDCVEHSILFDWDLRLQKNPQKAVPMHELVQT